MPRLSSQRHDDELKVFFSFCGKQSAEEPEEHQTKTFWTEKTRYYG